MCADSLLHLLLIFQQNKLDRNLLVVFCAQKFSSVECTKIPIKFILVNITMKYQQEIK